jgi:hypothetical protein
VTEAGCEKFPRFPDTPFSAGVTSMGAAVYAALEETRVKLEQASKVKVRMPTRLNNGEGRANDASTRSIRRGSELGTLGGWYE